MICDTLYYEYTLASISLSIYSRCAQGIIYEDREREYGVWIG